MNKTKRVIGPIGIIFGSLTLLLSLAITFGSSLGLSFVPTWPQIYKAVGLGENEPMEENCISVADVGDADCIVIQSQGECAVIDTGNVGDNGQKVLAFLKSRGVKQVDYLILTHYHDDHIGGAERIISELPVGIILLPEYDPIPQDSPLGARVLQAAENSTAKVHRLSEGLTFSVGDFRFEVALAMNEAKDDNDRSVVLKANGFDMKFLFMADAGEAAEKAFLAKFPDYKADFLKVGHHGSATASTEEFINAVHPTYAAISCGTRWESVPSSEVMKRLKNVGANIKRTDINSHIIYYFENGGVRIETER